MSRFNTGNPLGSNDPRDLDDNAKNMDLAVNAEQDTFQDRLGKSRLTWAGIVKAGSGDPAIAVDAAARAVAAAGQVEQNAEQIAQEAAQQAVDSVVIAVDDAVDRADAAADRAETARDAAFVNADVYPSVSEGRAAVADGEQFQVVEGDEIVRYRRDSASTQTEVARFAGGDQVRALANQAIGSPWRSHSAAFNLNSMDLRFSSAVKMVYSVGLSPATRSEPWQFGIVHKNDGANYDRMTIYGGSFDKAFTRSGIIENKEAGPVWITLTTNNIGETGYFKVLIDYRDLPDGVVCNRVGTNQLLISQSVHLEKEYLGVEYAAEVNARIDELKDGTSKIRNAATNGALDPAGASVTWANGSPEYLAPSELLQSKGIVRVANAGSEAVLNQNYKVEDISSERGKYYFASAYITASDGANYPGFDFFPYNGSSAVGREGHTTGYVQIDDQTRLKWSKGKLPDLPVTTVRLGGAYSSIADATVGGYTLAFSDEPIGINDVVRDGWDGHYAPSLADIPELRKQIESVSKLEGSAASTLSRAIRVSLAGSSITWGSGYLGEGSYVRGVEEYLRNYLAKTVHSSEMKISGSYSVYSSSAHYAGSAHRLSGVGAAAEFSLTGNELSLVLPRERGNDGACVAELYIDGALYDTFEVANDLPYQEGLVATFLGDGNRVKFDLGAPFTFAHVVTVGGIQLTGSVNAGSSGAGIPSGDDYTIIRQMVLVGGEPQVHHVLWLKNAPADGTEVHVTFSAGESIQYMKSFLGNTAKSLTSPLENSYGDGNIAYDPANPTPLSSGLGFRESDERAVKTWHFTNEAERTFRLQIKELSEKATGTTPVLWVNMATNRMHHLQNAGIGGWEAKQLLNDNGVNHIDYINKFRPDIVLLEFCTNDDWARGRAKAWITKTGVTDEWLRNVETAKYLREVTFVSADNYTVQDERISITAIEGNSATLDTANGTFNIAPGDAMIFGEFRNDNRRMAVRLVKTWDANSEVVTWGKRLTPKDLAHIDSLDDLVGSTVRFKNAPEFIQVMSDLTDSLQYENPDVEVIYATAGIPNDYDRQLTGYRELVNALARERGAGFADYYGITERWAYTQPANSVLYLNANQSRLSTGATRYPLYLENGSKPDPINGGTAYWRLMITSVLVDGVERLNRDCYIEGGRKWGWPDTVTEMSESNAQRWGSEYALVFTSDEPAPGAVIDVRYNSEKWSLDDCHPSAGVGRQILPNAIFGPLKSATVRWASRLGASV